MRFKRHKAVEEPSALVPIGGGFGVAADGLISKLKPSDGASAEQRPTELVLASPGTAAVEKAEADCRKRIKTWFALMRNAGAQMIGYRVMIGHELNQAKETIKHGEFEQWVEEEFGLSARTQLDWRDFSKLFLEELEKRKALPTVGKSASFALLGKTVPKKAIESILEIAPAIMDGKGYIQFVRDIKLLREPAEPGGYRPDPEMVAAFLAEKHADMVGTLYAALPEKIQAEFRKWLAALPEPPEDIVKRANAEADHCKTILLTALTGKWLMVAAREKRDDLLLLTEKLQEKIKGLELPRKSARGAKGEDNGASS